MGRWSWCVAVVALVLGGCVTTGEYKRREAELQGQAARQEDEARQRNAALKAEVESLQAQLKDLEIRLATTGTERDKLRSELDDTTALVAQLKQKLEKLGQNVDKLTGERGQLAQGLAEAKVRLEALRRQEAAVQEQVRTFRELVTRFRSMIDSGQLKVSIRKGRMIIALPNDVLFDSGRVKIKPAGREALAQVAKVLASIPDRDFLVAGHTDNVPIQTQQFPSNWELSTKRAIEVVEFLISRGVKAEALAAAGYGEFDPVVANDAPEHLALNRRIEIVLQPNLSELPELPTSDSSPTVSSTR